MLPSGIRAQLPGHLVGALDGRVALYASPISPSLFAFLLALFSCFFAFLLALFSCLFAFFAARLRALSKSV
jgi:hypothetical protein